MPELPDVEVYLEALQERVLGRTLQRVRLASPFLLRTAQPPIRDAEGRAVVSLSRLGKRLVFALEGELYLVLHLMIAGRLHWKEPGVLLKGKYTSPPSISPKGLSPSRKPAPRSARRSTSCRAGRP
jgi:formamidopyrimidine-DNA glycosylase